MHLMKIMIINGPNLNLLGMREPEVYGATSFEDYYITLEQVFISVKNHGTVTCAYHWHC